MLREHEALTRDFLPRADLVLFVSSADRPYTESERAFLAAIREWGKKVVLVLNKADLLRDATRISRRWSLSSASGRERRSGSSPRCSRSRPGARRPRDSRKTRPRSSAAVSPAFETQVAAMLDEHGRFRLKLLSPLGVARRALREADERALAGMALLEADTAALAAIEARLGGAEDDLTRDFRLRLSDVEKTLLEFERRGHAFFDERLRLGRFRELFDRERLRRDFEAEVTGPCPTRSSAGCRGSSTSWSRPSCANGRR